MRREEYERTYGRRSHVPPPRSSPAEDSRSRRSRTKMKCLISIGLILPALAAVIGVAAWAVSADVVMNSGNANRVSKTDNNLLQNMADRNTDDRRDIFRMNEENQMHRAEEKPSPITNRPAPRPPTQRPVVSTTTTPPPPPPPPSPNLPVMSPQDASDVNAILTKLISASGAASGGTGPRFVVVAPLPDNPEILASQSAARSDHKSSHAKQQGTTWRVSGHSNDDNQDGDLMISESRPRPHIEDLMTSESAPRSHLKSPPVQQRSSGNVTNRMGHSEMPAARRVGDKPFVINLSTGNNPHRHSFTSQIELSGFEPFDSMMQQEQQPPPPPPPPNPNPHPPPPPPGFAMSGPYTGSVPKRGPPQGLYASPSFVHHQVVPPPHFDNSKDLFAQHSFNMMSHQNAGGYGLKPIQQVNQPLRVEESRWGSIGFHPPPAPSYVHKPPEGISLSISSPANNKAHVSAEPVSVIKSFFLPFLPRPKLNMNARVVFGVVLDKGMGLGGAKKDAGHRHHY